MKKIIFLFAILITHHVSAQKDFIKNNRGGIFSLGNRSTISIFNDGIAGNLGTGLGGQFRIQFSDRVNTDWFADYITGNEGNYANRTDAHIGWSVLYYLQKPKKDLPKIQPYVLVGHCFDNSRISENGNSNNFINKGWSSAVQAGTGMHFNVSPRFDISTTAQYMIHIGADVHSSKNESGAVIFTKDKGVSLEGHLLFNVSLNYKIKDLW